jgi:hypothetical protein
VLIVFGNCAIVSLAFHPEIENLIAEIKSCRYCATAGPNPFMRKVFANTTTSNYVIY